MPRKFCANLNIFHGDIKENVSGCFFLNTVYMCVITVYVYRSSEEWQKIVKSDREKIGLTFDNDGEFWCVLITQGSQASGKIPECSGLFLFKFPGPGKSWKITLVLEGPGN